MTPRCPNHAVPMNRTDDIHIWICPISYARFTCEVDEMKGEIRLDKFGRPMQTWAIKQADGGIGG